MYCQKCGKEISNNAKFCEFCGIIQNNNKKSETIFSKKNINLLKYISEDLFKSYLDEKKDMIEAIEEKLDVEEYTDLDDLLYEGIGGMLDSAIKILQKKKIFKYSFEDIDDLFDKEYDVEDDISKYLEAEKNIINFSQSIELNNQIRKNSRSHWQGGGFGLSGAIKGALTASVLNAGSSMLHGVSNAISSYYDNKDKDAYKKAVHSSLDIYNEFSNALFKSYDHIKYIIIKIMQKENLLSQEYDFIENKDLCIREINGILKAFDGSIVEEEELKNYLSNLLVKYPYVSETYKIYFSLFGDSNKEKLLLTKKYGLYNEYIDYIKEVSDIDVNNLVKKSLKCFQYQEMKQLISNVKEINNQLPEPIYNNLIESMDNQYNKLIEQYEWLSKMLSKYQGMCLFKNLDELWHINNKKIDPIIESILLNIYTKGIKKSNNSIWSNEKELTAWPIRSYLIHDNCINTTPTAKAIVAMLTCDKKRFNLKSTDLFSENQINSYIDTSSPLGCYAKALYYKDYNNNSNKYNEFLLEAQSQGLLEAEYETNNNLLNLAISICGSEDDYINDQIHKGYTENAYSIYVRQYMIESFFKMLEADCYKNEEYYTYLKSVEKLYYNVFFNYNYFNNTILTNSEYEKANLFNYIKKNLSLQCDSSIAHIWDYKVSNKDYILGVELEIEYLKENQILYSHILSKWEKEREAFYISLEKTLTDFKLASLTSINQIKYINSIQELEKFNTRIEKEIDDFKLNRNILSNYQDNLSKRRDELQKIALDEEKNLIQNKENDIQSREEKQNCSIVENKDIIKSNDSKQKNQKKRSILYRLTNFIWRCIVVIGNIFILIGGLGLILQGEFLYGIVIIISIMYFSELWNLFCTPKKAISNFFAGITVILLYEIIVKIFHILF